MRTVNYYGRALTRMDIMEAPLDNASSRCQVNDVVTSLEQKKRVIVTPLNVHLKYSRCGCDFTAYMYWSLVTNCFQA